MGSAVAKRSGLARGGVRLRVGSVGWRRLATTPCMAMRICDEYVLVDGGCIKIYTSELFDKRCGAVVGRGRRGDATRAPFACDHLCLWHALVRAQRGTSRRDHIVRIVSVGLAAAIW